MTAALSLDGVSDPKQASSGSRSWYRYYAGYSPRFVSDSLRVVGAASGEAVLDPWMGAGTTLAVAAAAGLNALGLDLNPAMVVVTKARLLSSETSGSLVPLALELLDTIVPDRTTDPLSSWFTADTAGLLRGLTQRIDQVLIDSSVNSDDKVDQMSSLAAFYYVALFTVVKESIRKYQSKNPTWTKKGKIASGTVDLTREALRTGFIGAVRDLQTRLGQMSLLATDDARHEPVRGDTRSLPFAAKSIDHVITSPPYCTRLDYVVGHRPELAVLGYDDTEIAALRNSMIGTPTIQGDVTGGEIGETAKDFLDKVESHESYASKSYYAKTFRQYFIGMAQSMKSIDAVLKDGGNVIMVVQDSRYKDLHLDLARATADIASDQGWQLEGQKDFTALRSIAQVNPRTTEKTRTTKPVESVLHFKKKGK